MAVMRRKRIRHFLSVFIMSKNTFQYDDYLSNAMGVPTSQTRTKKTNKTKKYK